MTELSPRLQAGFMGFCRTGIKPEFLRRNKLENATFMSIEIARNQKRAGVAAAIALGSMVAWQCFAGHTLKWEQVPEPVRATVLANGGQVGPHRGPNRFRHLFPL